MSVPVYNERVLLAQRLAFALGAEDMLRVEREELHRAVRRMLRALDRLAYGSSPISMKYERYARSVAVYKGRRKQVEDLIA